MLSETAATKVNKKRNKRRKTAAARSADRDRETDKIIIKRKDRKTKGDSNRHKDKRRQQ